MEQGLGEEYIPGSATFDKSKVLNVRPLRSLVPIFPNAPNGSSFSVPNASAPFVSATPAGPFPNGTSPYYPFFGAQDSHRTSEPNTNTETPARTRVPKQSARPGINTTPISNAVPLNSFRAGRNQSSSVANGGSGSVSGSGSGSGSARRLTRSRAAAASTDDGLADNQNETGTEEKRKPGRPKRKSLGETSVPSETRDLLVSATNAEIESIVEKIKTVFNESFGEQTEGDRASVEYLTTVYDLFRRRVSQFEDIKESIPGLSRRPDLRAGTLFLNKGIRTNSKKRIGSVPGIEIGDIFFFRMELCLAGLHAPSMAGIDYLTVKKSAEEEPLAVSIVSSGGYEDYAEDPDILVYSGQGGVNRKDKEMKDQKLERGNLALEKSTHRANDVRVIRGVKDPATVAGKIYVYDGLYKIHESWTENAKNGFSVFKYKLVRQPGQPDGFRTWKSIESWKSSGSSRAGVILPDLTSGEEKIPVALVNDVDGEKGPAHFTYVSGLKNATSKKSKSAASSGGCRSECSGGCQPGTPSCPCIAKNGGSIPYTANGLLVNQKPIIPECGPACQCPPSCRNRTSQTGIKIRLEVFKTKNRGWGLRSWDPIRAGTFICEYAGEVVEPLKINRFGFDTDDDFVFDAARVARPLGILPGDDAETPELPYPFVISAKESGNVARFMNHSCAPNTFWQLVSRENDKDFDNHVGFYAVRHVPPMTELTFDYGVAAGEEAEQRKRKCLCGLSRCRGYFYQ